MEKKERTETFSFYNVLSWAVWGFFICWIFFMLFLLITGAMRRPHYRVDAARISAASAEDPELAARALPAEDWCKLELDVTVFASDWSPLRFEIDGFDLCGSEFLKRDGESFTVLPAPVVFTRAEPASFTLTCYLHSPDGQAALRTALESAGFCPTHYRHGLGFLKFESHVNVPSFYLKDDSFLITEDAA